MMIVHPSIIVNCKNFFINFWVLSASSFPKSHPSSCTLYALSIFLYLWLYALPWLLAPAAPSRSGNVWCIVWTFVILLIHTIGIITVMRQFSYRESYSLSTYWNLKLLLTNYDLILIYSPQMEKFRYANYYLNFSNF